MNRKVVVEYAIPPRVCHEKAILEDNELPAGASRSADAPGSAAAATSIVEAAAIAVVFVPALEGAGLARIRREVPLDVTKVNGPVCSVVACSVERVSGFESLPVSEDEGAVCGGPLEEDSFGEEWDEDVGFRATEPVDTEVLLWRGAGVRGLGLASGALAVSALPDGLRGGAAAVVFWPWALGTVAFGPLVLPLPGRFSR